MKNSTTLLGVDAIRTAALLESTTKRILVLTSLSKKSDATVPNSVCQTIDGSSTHIMFSPPCSKRYNRINLVIVVLNVYREHLSGSDHQRKNQNFVICLSAGEVSQTFQDTLGLGSHNKVSQ